MAAHLNLSCNDLKFRWKIEPIKKEEEKLKVLIKGEESALQKLLAQRESSASRNGGEAPSHHCAAGDATNSTDTNDGRKTHNTEDNRQETVLRLRCERRRKKLAEMHSQKEWVKLEIDRLSTENFLKKHPSVKKLARYYIKYPRDILHEEESWERVENIMAVKTAELCENKESERIGVEKTGQRCSQVKATTNMILLSTGGQTQIDLNQTDVEINEAETTPVQESACLFANDLDSSETKRLLGEDYLNEVTNANCPWQHDSVARADWEFAKALQLAPDSFDSISHTSKAFLDEPHRTQTNDKVSGQTSSKKMHETPQSRRNSNYVRRGHETTTQKIRSAASNSCSNTSGRRGRGGYTKQHQKNNRTQTAPREDTSISSPPPLQTYGKSLKTYAKAVTESRPSGVVPLQKKGDNTISKTDSKQKFSSKRSITSEPLNGSCKPKTVGSTRRLMEDESANKDVASSAPTKESDEIIHLPTHPAKISPTESQKRSKVNPATRSDKDHKIRRSSDTKVEYNITLKNKSIDYDTSASKKQGKQARTWLKRTSDIGDARRKSFESAKGIHSSPQGDVQSVERAARDRSHDISQLADAESPRVVDSTQIMRQITAQCHNDVSSSPTAEPRIVFIGIDEGDDVSITDEQGQYLCQPTTDSLLKDDDGKSSNQADSESTIMRIDESPNPQDINSPIATPNTAVEATDFPVIYVPPLDLSGLSNRSEDDSPTESKMVNFVGETYDNSIIIGERPEPIKHDVGVSCHVTSPARSGKNQNSSESHDRSVFDFFFQGHSTANKLPDGFPRFDTPRDKKHQPNVSSPSHYPMKAGDFKPFENSWRGGLPGANFTTLSPGRIDGYYSYIWSNHSQPRPTSDGWSHNEEASNHLKRMLRISTAEPPAVNSVKNSLFERGAPMVNNPAQHYAQFLTNTLNDTNDRGDPHVIQNKLFHAGIHDPFYLCRASHCASNYTAPTLPEQVPCHDEVPQRIRKSDSDEDFGSFFPSSSIFDSSFGI